MTQSDDIYLIAVDGGGTGCRAAVGTVTGGILAVARGGPGNVATNFDGSVRNIVAAVDGALADAGLPAELRDTAVAHLGLAGANSRAEMAKVEAALPFARCTVTGDRATATFGALGPQNGYLVALGTGTIVSRQLDGEISTVGGWGFNVSDEASGAWLGRALLTHALQAEDGIAAHSTLSRDILEKLGGRDAVVTFAAQARPGDFADLAPDVVEAAARGDDLARNLMRSGADYLTRALSALEFTPGDVLCLSGGLGPHYEAYLPNELTRNLHPRRGSALDGAFELARRAVLQGT